MCEIIVVTSGKGGVGKTTTTANLGAGLAMMRKKVLMIDTDIGLRNLDVVMGLEHRILYNLVDIVEGNCRIRQAVIRDRQFPGLYLIPAAQTRDKSAVTPEQMIKVVNELRDDFDYILLDSPAGIEQGFQVAIAGADRALVVTTPEISAVRDADRVIGLLFSAEINDIKLIVNRIRPDMIRQGQMLNLKEISDILCVDVIGAICDDEQVVISTNNGTPLTGIGTVAGEAYLNIVRRLLGEDVPLPRFAVPKTGKRRHHRKWKRKYITG